MERSPFSNRIGEAVNKMKEGESRRLQREADMADRAERRNAELAQAQARMRQLYIDAAHHLQSKGIPTEIGSATLGTNAGGVIGYYTQATEFVTVSLPDGWIIGRFTNGGAAQVLTPEGRIFNVAASRSAKCNIGDIYETRPENYTDFAVDEDGPFLARFDQYGENPPESLENEFMLRIASLLA